MVIIATPGAGRVSNASGAKTDRAELRKVVTRLGEGDVLIVTRLDRLARSTRDLLNTLHEITRRGAGFKSLADTFGQTPPRSAAG
jgi:DNA invertase Pin-like site-specific DNA recombinase